MEPTCWFRFSRSFENHPCEILSDYFGLSQLIGDITDLKYSFIGSSGNILNSWVHMAEIYSLDFQQIFSKSFLTKGSSIKTTDRMDEIESSDIILTDPFPKEFSENNPFTITQEIVRNIGKEVYINPCPPFRRNVDITDEVLQSDNFVGYDFKKSLVYVQKGIIEFCLKK
jgi:ornithine carbamoyltransferase